MNHRVSGHTFRRGLAFALVVAAIAGELSGRAQVGFLRPKPGGGQLSGTVTEGAGRPISKAMVILHRAGEGTLAKMETDANGSYAFDDLPSGSYIVEFAQEAFDIVRRHGITVATDRTTVDVGAHLTRTNCECAPPPSGATSATIKVTVTDRERRPVAHARIELAGARPSMAYTGVDGSASVTLPIGSAWTLSVTDMYFATETRTIKVARRNTPLEIHLSPRVGVEYDGVETLKRPCACGGPDADVTHDEKPGYFPPCSFLNHSWMPDES